MDLKPKLTMAEVYGPHHVYAPRAHPKTCEWIIPDRAVLDGVTGNQLVVAGNMEVVCSAGVTTNVGVELLREAGLEPAASTHSHCDEQHAIEMASLLGQAGRKIVVQHIYPRGVLNASELWIDAGVLSYLNNKANLVELVPEAHVATRYVVNPEKLFVIQHNRCPSF